MAKFPRKLSLDIAGSDSGALPSAPNGRMPLGGAPLSSSKRKEGLEPFLKVFIRIKIILKKKMDLDVCLGDCWGSWCSLRLTLLKANVSNVS